VKRISDLPEWNDASKSAFSGLLPEHDARLTNDREVHLMVPAFEVANPEFSIVIPALNEALTIGPFVEWCHEGLRRANVRGEILIIDSSTDGTAQIAISKGARVLKTPKRGLGRAYIDALPFIRGKYVLMGDADCTYDFRDIEPFIESLQSGHEFVMGSRFRGSIEPGSMPPHHRYFGTPLTTWILNFLYASGFSDIHCGMRGITRDALQNMSLQSQSWEYASEMVLKSVRMNLRTAEVPVHFLKDREGRFSHHKRAGWLSPWAGGWTSLKTMFIYGADFFLLRPGLLLLFTGLLLTVPLAFGPLTIGRMTLSLNWMLLGLALSVLGLHGFYVGSLARMFLDYTGEATRRLLTAFSYTRSVALSAAAGIAGAAMAIPLIREYLHSGNPLANETLSSTHLAVAGLLFLVAGFMNFTFTLALHAAAVVVKRK
jgi:glycosyltransferase involved in cell wall biosynthesis